MIIATTVTTVTTKESDDKSQIRSKGTNKFVPTFLIPNSSPPAYFHYHHHHHHLIITIITIIIIIPINLMCLFLNTDIYTAIRKQKKNACLRRFDKWLKTGEAI